MKSSYIDYSMSVIVSRALPDVRDGFKPVHRRKMCIRDRLYSVELRGHFVNSISDRDRIQTCNRLIRSQLLYSVELRDHCFVLTGANIRTFPELASISTTFL